MADTRVYQQAIEVAYTKNAATQVFQQGVEVSYLSTNNANTVIYQASIEVAYTSIKYIDPTFINSEETFYAPELGITIEPLFIMSMEMFFSMGMFPVIQALITPSPQLDLGAFALGEVIWVSPAQTGTDESISLEKDQSVIFESDIVLENSISISENSDVSIVEQLEVNSVLGTEQNLDINLSENIEDNSSGIIEEIIKDISIQTSSVIEETLSLDINHTLAETSTGNFNSSIDLLEEYSININNSKVIDENLGLHIIPDVNINAEIKSECFISLDYDLGISNNINVITYAEINIDREQFIDYINQCIVAETLSTLNNNLGLVIIGKIVVDKEIYLAVCKTESQSITVTINEQLALNILKKIFTLVRQATVIEFDMFVNTQIDLDAIMNIELDYDARMSKTIESEIDIWRP